MKSLLALFNNICFLWYTINTMSLLSFIKYPEFGQWHRGLHVSFWKWEISLVFYHSNETFLSATLFMTDFIVHTAFSK
jgi:hypothetical protein